MKVEGMTNNSAIKKRGLGRGLGALIVNTERAADTAQLTETGLGIQHLPVEQIAPNPRQPRTYFEEAALEELATSIRTHGIIQPLIVTQSDVLIGTYHLIAGERRWRAARLAGLTTVPALVREASPSQLIEWALIENIQRADLNPLEEAAAYQALIEEYGLTQDEVADRVGKSRPAVGNAVRLLRLPASVQAALTEGQISAGHARAILPLEKPEMIEQICAEIVRRALSVRQTEALVKLMSESAEPVPAPPEPAIAPQIAHLENQFRAKLNTRVNLSRNANGSGRLVIHFYNDDDLEQLYQLIAGEDEGATP